jgi:hypothetical protein
MFKKNRALLIALTMITGAIAFAAQSLPQMRMTPKEILTSSLDENQIGSSGVRGVHTKIVYGDPSKAGFYTILLFVPPKTVIQAHAHRDSRVATVVTGSWSFGYGDHFDPKSLKTLPPGSVYSEPGGVTHFAKSGGDAVVVQISGYGPTDTVYFDPANDPSNKKN